MDCKTVWYIGYFENELCKEEKRSYSPAAQTKTSYIRHSIKMCGYKLNVLSAGGTKGKVSCPMHEYVIDEQENMYFLPSLGRKGFLSKLLRRIQFHREFCRFFKQHIRKTDKVIAYHSLGYMKMLKRLKRKIGFSLVLEVEEIYSDAMKSSPANRDKELALFRLAEGYLFSTELLNDVVNITHKPYAINYGTYQVEPRRESCGFSSDPLHHKKHILYAGTFDARKKGAAIAIAAMAYLPKEYHLHVLGFGTEDDKNNVKALINDISKLDCATVTMDGLLTGEEYIRFVQSCDIGFSTQHPFSSFNDTSFPSKVLSYLSNGLRVVSVRIPAIEKSEVNDLLFYYDGEQPKDVAEAVLRIDWSKEYDSRKAIEELDKKFKKEMAKVLSLV